jgi:hypothetical protein
MRVAARAVTLISFRRDQLKGRAAVGSNALRLKQAYQARSSPATSLNSPSSGRRQGLAPNAMPSSRAPGLK